MSGIPWDKILTFTPSDLAKVAVSAIVIMLATKIQFVSDRLSALPVALPLTSLIALIWMYHAGQTPQRLANHAESTFWFVLPTLPMFLILPWMLRHGWAFWPALATNAVITLGLFWFTTLVLKQFGIDLFRA